MSWMKVEASLRERQVWRAAKGWGTNLCVALCKGRIVRPLLVHYFRQANYRAGVGVSAWICQMPRPQATQHRLAEQLRELSVLVNDVLLGSSDSDAVCLHIIYYTFRALRPLVRCCAMRAHAEIMLASSFLRSQRIWQCQPVCFVIQ